MITNKIDYKVYSNKPFAIWANSRIINERLSANSYNRDYLDFAKAKNTFNFKKVSDIAKVTAMIGWKGLTTDDYVDEDGVYLLRTVDIKDNYIDLENAVMAKREKVYEQPQIILKQGDIIFSKDGTLGITAIVPRHQNKEMCVGSTLARIRLNSNLDNYYVCAAFMSKIVQAQIGYFTSGIAQPHITQEYINKLEIPIPSPEIQKYIGDKVRKAEELREEAKRLIKEAEEILYSQLKQEQYLEKQKSIVNKYIWLSDKEVDTRIDSQYYKPNYILYKHILNKNGIKTKKIKDVVKDIRTGTTPQSNYITKDEKRIKFLRVNNLGYCILEKDDMLYVNDKYDEKKLKIIPKGDILVSIAGTLGRSSVVDMDNCTINQNIAALTLKNINFIKPYYLSLYLNSYFGYLSLDTISTQATVKYINNELLGEIEIPLIDIDIQLIIEEKIARYKNKINKSKQLIQEAKQDVEDLIEGNFDMSKIKVNN